MFIVVTENTVPIVVGPSAPFRCFDLNRLAYEKGPPSDLVSYEAGILAFRRVRSVVFSVFGVCTELNEFHGVLPSAYCTLLD